MQFLGEYLKDVLRNLWDEKQGMNVSELELSALCGEKMEEVLKMSQNHLTWVFEIMHNKENDTRNHMRSHYDELLTACRVSYRLERDRYSNLSLAQQEIISKKMSSFYREKIKDLRRIIEQNQDEHRMLKKNIVESKTRADRIEKDFQDVNDEFHLYRSRTEEALKQLKSELNQKRKQEVWAHFKINHQKKKLKTMERKFEMKKKDLKEQKNKGKILQDRLDVSLRVRSGLEKAFERRICARGRFDDRRQDTFSLSTKRPQTSLTPQRPSTVFSINTSKRRPNTTIGCETSRDGASLLRHSRWKGVEAKGKKTNTRGTNTNDPLTMENLEMMESRLVDLTGRYEAVNRQNVAYKKLLTGQNIAMILATQHRNVCPETIANNADLFHELVPSSSISHQPILHDEARPDDSTIPSKSEEIYYQPTQGREEEEEILDLNEGRHNFSYCSTKSKIMRKNSNPKVNDVIPFTEMITSKKQFQRSSGFLLSNNNN